MGQITGKEVGRTSYNPLQHVKYKYNIRGWLYEVNDINLSQGQLFFFGLKYNTGSIRFYNGNIGETIWKSASDNSIRKYNFNYDGLSRLRRAYYTNISKNIRGTFDVWVSYDENGNITYLGRNGGFESATFAQQIDKLYYTYKNRSNQLKKVVDLTNDSQGFDNGTSGSNDDYTYDAYGNMITDKNKGITNIVYNIMNLPVHIQFGSKGSIDYVYDASGAKQSKKVHYGSYNVVTYYVDGYQYEAKPAAQGGRNYSELLFFPTAEGYAKAVYSKDLSKKTPLSYKYVYIYKDHLGNNRMSYALDPLTGKAKILEENHYYPFGLRHQAYTAQARSLVIDENVKIGKPGTDPIIIAQVPKEEVRYKYRYNGKELQEEHGLNWYDYGARNYDATLGRWMNIDLLSEEYYSLSPYNYTTNNPIYFIDPDGRYVTRLGAFWGWLKTGFKGKIFKSDNASTPFHKFGISKTTFGKNGSVTFNIKYGKTKNEMINNGAIETNDGRLEWHGTIKKTNLIQDASLIRSAPAETTSDKFLKIGVELTYGVVDDVQGLFTGRSMSGEDLKTNDGVEKRIMGMVTLGTFGLEGYLKSLTTSKEVLKSTPSLYRSFAKETKGMFKGAFHHQLRSRAYHQMIKTNNMAHGLIEGVGMYKDVIRYGTIINVNN